MQFKHDLGSVYTVAVDGDGAGKNGLHCTLWEHVHMTAPAPLPWIAFRFCSHFCGAVDGIIAMDSTDTVAVSCKWTLRGEEGSQPEPVGGKGIP